MYESGNNQAVALDKIVKDINRMTDGQFNIILKQTDMGLKPLVNALNTLMRKLRNLIGTFIDVSDRTTKVAKNLKRRADSLAESSQEISNAIETVAESACQQAKHLDDIEERIGNFVISLDEIEKTADNTYQSSVDSKGTVHSSMEVFQKIHTSVLESKSHNDQLADELKNLKDKINKINAIITVVDGIARQTRILALNASIEAARAGNAGKGFDVVASEVGKLADSSSESAKEIGYMVKTIIKSISGLSELAEKEAEASEKTTKSVEELTQKSKNIESAVLRNMEEAQKITTLTKSQASNSKELKSVIEKTSEISKNNAAVSQQIIVASAEQMVNVNQVMQSIVELVAGVEDTNRFSADFIKGFKMDDLIRQKVEKLKDILKEMISKPEVFKSNRQTIEAYMKKFQKESGFIELMIYIGRDGMGIAETNGLENRLWKDCSSKAYFHAGMRGESYISREYISKSSGNYNITLSVPVYDRRTIIGVLMADIDINEY